MRSGRGRRRNGAQVGQQVSGVDVHVEEVCGDIVGVWCKDRAGARPVCVSGSEQVV